MKKFFALLLATAIIFTATANTTAYAANPDDGIMPQASFLSYTKEMVGIQTVSFSTANVGTSPTFKFWANGNPDLNLKVTATTPGGTYVTLFESVPANGTVVSKHLTTFVSGSFTINIMVASGSSSGQRKDCHLEISW